MHNLYTIIKSVLALKTKLLARGECSVANTDRNTFLMFTSAFTVKKSALSVFKVISCEDMNIFVLSCVNVPNLPSDDLF